MQMDWMKPEVECNVRDVLRAGIQEGVAPGFVAAVWYQGKTYGWCEGNRRLIPSMQPMLPNTLFDIASVSKVFATASLTAALVQRRWISFDTPLSRILPGKWEINKTPVLIAHLLAHTGGFAAWAPFWQQLKGEFGEALGKTALSLRQDFMKKCVMQQQPEVEPGSRALYSDISFLLLGYALEQVAAEPLDRAVRRHVWDSIEIARAHYVPTLGNLSSLQNDDMAATENCAWRGGVIQGSVHDDNCWAMGGVAGHAGVFTDAASLLKWGVSWLQGEWLSRSVVDKMLTPLRQPGLAPFDCTRTLGWDTPSGEAPCVGKLTSPDVVGHLGFTGTSLWLDRRRKWVAVLLSNRVHPTRENILIRPFRSRFHSALAKKLMLEL